jgi:hypothetical protein
MISILIKIKKDINHDFFLGKKVGGGLQGVG